MSIQKNCLMAIPVVGAIATFNITSPVLAANQIALKINFLGLDPFEASVSIAAFERFVQTGDTSGLPPGFSHPFLKNYLENLRQQLNRPIRIDPNSPLDPLEQGLVNSLLPDSTEEQRKSALTLMAQKANGKILINFLKALPGDIITSKNFLESLNAYQETPSKPSGAEQAISFLSTSSGQVGTINLLTGTFTQVTNGPAFLDIALSEDHKLFGVSGSNLYSIDPISGMSSLIGNLGASLNALGFSSNNVLYGAGGSNFYTVDPLRFTASLVASIPGFLSSGDIVFDSINNRFLATSIGLVSDSLFSIDLTGNASKIGDIGFSGVIGSFFDNGNLFAYTVDGKQLLVNPETGVGTFDKNVTGASGLLYGAASLPSTGPKTSVPEPSAVFSLLAFGTFGASSLLKRKRQQKVLNLVASD